MKLEITQIKSNHYCGKKEFCKFQGGNVTRPAIALYSIRVKVQ